MELDLHASRIEGKRGIFFLSGKVLSIINLEAQLDRWPPGSPRRQAYNPTEWECLEHTYNLLPLGHELLDYKPGGHKQEEKHELISCFST